MVPALTRLLWPRPAAEALAKVKAANASASFRDLFPPGDRPPLPGLLSRRLDLAAVLDAVADQGISAFYGGNLTHEMAAAVRNDFHHTHKVTLPQECNSWGSARGNESVASKIHWFPTPQFEVWGLMGLLCEQVDSQPLSYKHKSASFIHRCKQVVAWCWRRTLQTTAVSCSSQQRSLTKVRVFTFRILFLTLANLSQVWTM